MVSAIARLFPASVSYTDPEGGMFLWARLPDGISAMHLFEQGIKGGVCIVPGHPFYLRKDDISTVRLSFSCVDETTIQEGIRRLSTAVYQLCDQAS